ncbi:MAG: hypothetical protein ACKOCU_11615, partial [Betaproteobacteria bacterium]
IVVGMGSNLGDARAHLKTALLGLQGIERRLGLQRWAEHHHPEFGTIPTAWGPVLGVILALMLGATALMATVSFVGQRLFEALLAA